MTSATAKMEVNTAPTTHSALAKTGVTATRRTAATTTSQQPTTRSDESSLKVPARGQTTVNPGVTQRAAAKAGTIGSRVAAIATRNLVSTGRVQPAEAYITQRTTADTAASCASRSTMLTKERGRSIGGDVASGEGDDEVIGDTVDDSLISAVHGDMPRRLATAVRLLPDELVSQTTTDSGSTELSFAQGQPATFMWEADRETRSDERGAPEDAVQSERTRPVRNLLRKG
ncbi:hypothetical protein ON010_g18883 [Phytophthora cinnamomi]|nr:hypothetical protein ON010_g18883 [Phytophthora cinnamomi]